MASCDLWDAIQHRIHTKNYAEGAQQSFQFDAARVRWDAIEALPPCQAKTGGIRKLFTLVASPLNRPWGPAEIKRVLDITAVARPQMRYASIEGISYPAITLYELAL